MYVRSLSQKPYGPFADRVIRFGTGLTLAVGVNEAGKSTALEALCDLLWGIPVHTDQTFLYGRPALKLEATLSLPGGDELGVVRRSTGLYDGTNGAEIGCDWQTENDSRTHWRASFGLSHAALREGGEALCRGEGDLAQLVFAARTGHGVRRLLRKINESADELYKEHKGAKTVQVRVADNEYQRLLNAVTDASAMAHKVLASKGELNEAEADFDQAQRRKRHADGEVTSRRARVSAADYARELHALRTRFAAVQAAGLVLAEPALAEWESAAELVNTTTAKLARLESGLVELRTEREAIVVDQALLDDGPEIAQLHLACEARLADGRQARELLDEAEASRRAAAALVSSLTGPGDARPIETVLESLHVPTDLVAQLDQVADELARTVELVDRRQEALDSAITGSAGVAPVTAVIDAAAVAAVEEACAAIRADGSSVDLQRKAMLDRTEAIRRRDGCLLDVGLPGGAVPQGVLPSTEAIRKAKQLQTTRQQEHHHLQKGLVEVGRRLSRLRAELDNVNMDDAPTVDSLSAARQARDEAVARLVQAWLADVPAGDASELPRTVDRGIEVADGIADRLFTGAEAAAGRARLISDVKQAEAESADLVARVGTAAAEVDLAAVQWTALWHGMGRTPSTDEAERMRQHVADARAADAGAAAAGSAIRDLRDQVERQTTALSSALARAGRARPDADLDSLLAAARQLVHDSDEQRIARARTEDAEKRVRDARTARDEARLKHDVTLSRWHELTRSAGMSEHVDRVGWSRRQHVAGNATKAMRQAEHLSSRARAVGAAHEAFATRALGVAQRHGVVVGDDIGRAMNELSSLLGGADAARAQVAQLDEKIARLTADAQATEYELTMATACVEKIRVELRATDVNELADAALRGRTLVELTADVDRLTELVKVALPGVDVDQVVPELAATDPEELVAAAREAERDVDDLHDELEASRDRRAEIKEAHRSLIHRPGAADVRAQAQGQLATLEERAERYVVAHIQRTILEAELADYETRHATSLLAEAGQLLEDLTAGRYVGLRTAHQGSGRALVVLTADEEIRTMSDLSEGTADQVFLALRLAGIAALQAERRAAGVPTLPVVLDDVLMTFDDNRAAAALRVMARLAREWQVIVFSHHVHLADIAGSLDLANLTVSRLQPPDAVLSTRTPEAIRAATVISGGDGAALPVGQSTKQLATADTPAASEIRDWARRNGHQLGGRGRIPATIIQAYERANSR
jgi:uncharacterized protein YhaN